MQKNTSFIIVVILVLCNTNNAIAQRYVDIHSHISLKNYIRATEHPDSINPMVKHLRYENWQTTNNYYQLDQKSNQENYYQADFTTLAGGNFKIICNSLTPFEQNSVYNYIKVVANSAMESHVAQFRLENIYATTPYRDLRNEMTFVSNQGNLVIDKNNPVKFKVVKNSAELKECVGNGTVAIINTIEGGHALYGQRAKDDKYFLNPNCDGDCEAEILQNLHELKNMEYRVLFMGICHLFSNKLAGHAKALDVGANTAFNRFVIQRVVTVAASVPGIRKLLDVKRYEGLRDGDVNLANKRYNIDNSAIGMKVIKGLLDSNNVHHKPILVDIKHMDIQTRKDYYRILDTTPQYRNLPIIASHAAASGKTEKIATITGTFPYYDRYRENRKPVRFYKHRWKKWQRKYSVTDADYPKQSGFLNPFSFNLYDEEIQRIYNSKGLIGVIFEQRTLGGYMRGYNYDRTQVMTRLLRKKYKLNDIEITAYFYSEPFMRNLFYFIEHSGRQDKTAWETVTLGSDFDGFIDPINACPTAAFLPGFERRLQQFIPIYLDIEYHNDKLLYGYTVAQALDKLFFENAENFIYRNF